MDKPDAITEAVKNVDVMSMLRSIVTIDTTDEQSEEIKEKIQGVLEEYETMDDAEKNAFVEQLREAFALKLSMKMQNEGESYWQMILAVTLVIFFIVFFGYKLFKSIKEKEKKREEKKKQKQSKKKK